MSNLSFVNEQLLNEKVYLSYKMTNTKDINNNIYNILVEKVENKCYMNGYTFKVSLKLIYKTSITSSKGVTFISLICSFDERLI